MKEIFKFRKKTPRELQQEQWDKPYKEITHRHFNAELIDWNVQTCMYDMLTNVIHNIDDVHLKTFAQSYKEGWNDCIEIQLRDAIIDVLKHKKLIEI